MPDPTPFALWQDRLGLSRAVDAAKVLGLTREHAHALRRGPREPGPQTRIIMELLEKYPREIKRRLTSGPTAPPRETPAPALPAERRRARTSAATSRP